VTRALVVIDGEHYAPVVRDALAALAYEVAGAWLAGGEEKLRGGDEYGVPLYHDLDEALSACEPELVYDLSDEPVLGPRERFLVASRVLAAGIPYAGADFRFDPPPLRPFPLPSLGIVGTGKRVGKTAVSGHAARLLARDREVIVVAMGRGGPPEPEVAEWPPSPAELLALSRAGRHAASDYLEDAALAGVVTIGCRRAGGGLAGATAFSNVHAGADEALARSPDLVIFEGSGSALPPVQTSRRVLVAPAGSNVTGYLNAYRLLTSDLLVLTMAEGAVDTTEIRALRPDLPIVPVVLRPRPIEPIAGRSVAFFSTAPVSAQPLLAAHLRDVHGAAAVTVSGNLARRAELTRDLERAGAEVWLVELKAAAIDVVAEEALARGVPLVLVDNEVLSPELDAELLALAQAAREEVAV
jgi:cyclic 2,3-diphosphoglycerate synthetase